MKRVFMRLHKNTNEPDLPNSIQPSKKFFLRVIDYLMKKVFLLLLQINYRLMNLLKKLKGKKIFKRWKNGNCRKENWKKTSGLYKV